MKSREELEQELATEIATALEASVKESGAASLLVSGGSTPIQLFQLLSTKEITWNKVLISLVDERIVPPSHQDSNARLVREHLLQNLAKEAQFIPLVHESTNPEQDLIRVKEEVKKMSRPFTVVVLGMGKDGHTASLFPHSPQLEQGMDLTNSEELIITEPQTAPYQRVSFTRAALLQSKRLFLHCYGEEKKSILTEIDRTKEARPYPISGFIHQDRVKLEVFWTN